MSQKNVLSKKGIYPQNFEQKIGFDRLRNILMGYCLSDLGKSLVEKMAFLTQTDAIILRHQQIEEFKEILILKNDFPTNYFIDARPFLDKLDKEGVALSATQFFDLKRSLETIKAIQNFFGKQEKDKYTELRKILGAVNLYSFIFDRLNQVFNKQGEIRDNASPELQNIRAQIYAQQSVVQKTIHKILNKAQSEGWAEKEASLAARDGKLLVPVLASGKRKIKGIVHDQSSTGRIAYVEPFEVMEANNMLRELEFDERREMLKILLDLTDEFRPYSTELKDAYQQLAVVDFVRAKSLFAISVNANKITITENPQINLAKAIHPLLFLNFKTENKTVVPLDITLDQENRLLLISGPNAGGKSVCLKTVGLIQYMAQCGLQVPAKPGSELGVFKKLFIDIGDEQSLENDLSTYSSHLSNMKYFLDKANSETLILIDEFGTGTEPILGGAIAETTLEELNRKHTFGVITTHYANLKHTASSLDGIVNGAMLFDQKQMQPLFMLEIGKPGSSFAIEIAQRMGFSKEFLAKAEKKAGKDHVDFEKHLQDIDSTRFLLKTREKELAKQQEQLQKEIEYYKNETEFTLKQRKNILKITNEQAQDILNTANKKIENTIFEIRQSQAEKEQTKKIRKELQEFAQDHIEKQNKQKEEINRKMDQILRRQERKKNKKDQPQSTEQPIKKQPQIQIGSIVRLKGQTAQGQVQSIQKNKALIISDTMQLNIDLKNLELVPKSQIKKVTHKTIETNYTVKKTSSDFVFSLDVRGQRGEQAISIVARYLDEAVAAQASQLKILHGTGTGILRTLIREYLQAQPYVSRVYDEKIEMGGAGITIVELDL